MWLESSNFILKFSSSYYPYLILTSFVWFTYWRALKGGFVSDDIAGIAEYTGVLQTNDNPEGKPELTVTRPKIANTQYGMFSRWLRYQICGGNFPSGTSYPDPTGKMHEVPQGKIPWRHHALSIITFNIAILLGYYFLKGYIGPNLALLSLLLFVAHPLGTQAIAWPSAFGYPLSLCWIFISLIIANSYYGISEPSTFITMAYIFGFLLIQFLAINALFIAIVTPILMLFMGYYEFAFLGALMAGIQGLQIVKHTIDIRKNEFKKQAMGDSTYVHWRKIIVAIKTLWYYMKHVVYPNKMGLYHHWGFHYSKELERDNKQFWISLIGVLTLGIVFFQCPITLIKFSILWFVGFLFIFLNWVTIQQFVTERYCFIPSLGFCIIVAYFTQNYLWFYGFILGVYICRTWVQLPAYDNEMKFYQSNVWNFEDSEVAYGNLGVTALRAGLVGTALEYWQIASKINPEYDVPHYNLYSHYKSNGLASIQNGAIEHGFGMLKTALPFLEKCVACKVCHFRELWAKELEEIKGWLENPQWLINGEVKRQTDLYNTLCVRRSQSQDAKDIEGIDISLRDITKRLEMLKTVKFQRS